MNAARCFSGTHATVRFIEETVVTSATCVKRVLTWARSKWTKDSRTFNEEEDEDTLVEEGLELERGTVFHKDTWHSEIFPRNIVTKRLPREACFDQGDCQVQKDVVKTLSWRRDLKLNAARCFSGTHATVRFTTQTVVTSGSCVKRVLTRAMSKWRTSLLPLMKRKMKAFSLRKERLPCEACFDLGDV